MLSVLNAFVKNTAKRKKKGRKEGRKEGGGNEGGREEGRAEGRKEEKGSKWSLDITAPSRKLLESAGVPVVTSLPG